MRMMFLILFFVMMPAITFPDEAKITTGIEGSSYSPTTASKSDAGYSRTFCIRDANTGSHITIQYSTENLDPTSDQTFDGKYSATFSGGRREGTAVLDYDWKRNLINVQDHDVMLGHIDLKTEKAAIAVTFYCGDTEIIATDHYSIGECK